MLRASSKNLSVTMTGKPGTTVRIAGADTAQGLGFTDQPIAALITCEDNDVRYAFGADPTQGASPLGHLLAVGGSIRLGDPDAVANFKFINKVAATVGVIQVTPEY